MNFGRAMLCKRCLCCHAMPVTFEYSTERNKHIFKIFHHWVATSFYFFHIKVVAIGNILMGTSLAGASNAGGVAEIVILSTYLASSRTVNAVTG